MKPKGFQFGLLAWAAGLALAMCGAAGAQTSAPQLYVQSVSVGAKPMGVTAGKPRFGEITYVGVANSGDDTVSLFTAQLASINSTLVTLKRSAVIQGIPGAHSISYCPNGIGNSHVYIVTSPATGAIYRIVEPTSLNPNPFLSLKVGSQPYAAGCLVNSAVVSNYADSTVTIVDNSTFTIKLTIPNVPGGRGPHSVLAGSSSVGDTAWIAGTDANMVTVIELSSGTIVARLPVRGPTSIFCCIGNDVAVTGSTDNAIYTFNSRFTLTQTIPNVPNPQDFSNIFLGNLAITGSEHAVSQVTNGGVSTITGMVGAAALVGSWASFCFTCIPAEGFLLATIPETNSMFFVQLQPQPPLPPLPKDFSLSNAASFAGNAALAPGALGSIFVSTGLQQNFNANSVPLPKTLGGFGVKIGGSLNLAGSAQNWVYSSTGAVDAALLFAGPNQVNFQDPPGIAPGSAVPAQLTKPDGTTLLTTLNITATAPGIFTVLQNGQGQAAVLNQDLSQNGNPQSIVGAKPAARGSVIQIYATGGGETTPSLLPGQAADPSGNPLVLTNVQPTVTIGGQQATVQFSGMAPGYVGLWQVNAQIPQSVTPGNAVPLVVTAGGVASNTVTIAVQ